MSRAPRPCVCKRALAACDHSCSRDLLDVTYFTPFLNLTDRPCLVVGAGPVGLEKVEGLLAANAAVTVVAPRVIDEIAELAEEGSLALERREYASRISTASSWCSPRPPTPSSTCGSSATPTPARCWSTWSTSRRSATSSCRPWCGTGPIAIAISTSGASPALAKRLKREIAEQFGEPYARLADLLNDLRPWAKETFGTYQERKVFFEDLVNGDPDPVALIAAGDDQAVHDLIAERVRAAEASLAA